MNGQSLDTVSRGLAQDLTTWDREAAVRQGRYSGPAPVDGGQRGIDHWRRTKTNQDSLCLVPFHGRLSC